MNEEHSYEKQRGSYRISTDLTLLDLDMIHQYLHHSYWSPGIPRDVVEKAIANSLNFGLYDGKRQIGFGRVVTDYASYAYLADVFVLPEARGGGLGVWLIDCITSCPALAGIRTFALATRDAHDLYRKYGFENPPQPERWMFASYNAPWYDTSLVTDPPTREPESMQ